MSDRDVIIVLGKTGYGKSIWCKSYSQDQSRLLLYDPMMSGGYNVEYTSMGSIYDCVSEDKTYRFGTIKTDEVHNLGDLAFVSGNNLCIIEECSTVFESRQTLPSWAKRLIFLGRHNRCSLIFISQRPFSIPIALRSQANRVVTFQQHEDDDVSWLKGFYGKERIQTLPSLPKFFCLDYQDGIVSRYSVENLLPRIKRLEAKNDVENREKVFQISEENDEK